MFEKGTVDYKSDVKLGEKYRDTDTGYVGTASAITFYQHACERVTLKSLDKDDHLIECTFDAPELEHLETRATPRTEKTGGARPTPAPRGSR